MCVKSWLWERNDAVKFAGLCHRELSITQYSGPCSQWRHRGDGDRPVNAGIIQACRPTA
jgi:hypothetical protein